MAIAIARHTTQYTLQLFSHHIIDTAHIGAHADRGRRHTHHARTTYPRLSSLQARSAAR